MDGKPLFVNEGTYEYQGELRKHFRQTFAHNTVVIDGHEQSQCWGGFRVAKRISGVQGEKGTDSVKGKYTNYLGEEHAREIFLNGGVMKVVDTVEATDGVEVKSFLHIAPGFVVEGGIIKEKDGSPVCKVQADNCDMNVVKDGDLCYYSAEFSDLKIGSCLVFSWKADDKKHGYNIDFNV